MRYDTIRDAILTCARKPTGVGLIYRTETTSKNCKTEKLKSKSRYVRSNSKSLGHHVVSSEEEKERLQWEGFAEKGFTCGMKENSIELSAGPLPPVGPPVTRHSSHPIVTPLSGYLSQSRSTCSRHYSFCVCPVQELVAGVSKSIFVFP